MIEFSHQNINQQTSIFVRLSIHYTSDDLKCVLSLSLPHTFNGTIKLSFMALGCQLINHNFTVLASTIDFKASLYIYNSQPTVSVYEDMIGIYGQSLVVKGDLIYSTIIDH